VPFGGQDVNEHAEGIANWYRNEPVKLLGRDPYCRPETAELRVRDALTAEFGASAALATLGVLVSTGAGIWSLYTVAPKRRRGPQLSEDTRRQAGGAWHLIQKVRALLVSSASASGGQRPAATSRLVSQCCLSTDGESCARIWQRGGVLGPLGR
jgi:hypothetical protein